MGDLSGDTNADVKATDGHTSQWIKVHVTENHHDIGGRELKATATLTSPPGTTFELYTYIASADGVVECSAVSGTGNSYNARFGESGITSNGSNDSRWVTYEVRHVSGPCDPSKKWSLKIEGNK